MDALEHPPEPAPPKRRCARCKRIAPVASMVAVASVQAPLCADCLHGWREAHRRRRTWRHNAAIATAPGVALAFIASAEHGWLGVAGAFAFAWTVAMAGLEVNRERRPVFDAPPEQ